MTQKLVICVVAMHLLCVFRFILWIRMEKNWTYCELFNMTPKISLNNTCSRVYIGLCVIYIFFKKRFEIFKSCFKDAAFSLIFFIFKNIEHLKMIMIFNANKKQAKCKLKSTAINTHNRRLQLCIFSANISKNCHIFIKNWSQNAYEYASFLTTLSETSTAIRPQFSIILPF